MRSPVFISALGFIFAAATATVPALGQDADKIVNQYIKAQGGAKTLSKAQTVVIEGTITNAADGKSGTYTLDTKLPNRYYSELIVGEKSVIEAYNGKSAWHQTPTGEISTLVGLPGTQLEAAGQYYNSRLVNAKKNKLGIAFVGHAQVRGKDTLQIEVTTLAGLKPRFTSTLDTPDRQRSGGNRGHRRTDSVR